jgi:hypothetical protein
VRLSLLARLQQLGEPLGKGASAHVFSEFTSFTVHSPRRNADPAPSGNVQRLSTGQPEKRLRSSKSSLPTYPRTSWVISWYVPVD